MSKTPRTDAVTWHSRNGRVARVNADFAKGLELELSASTAALKAARDKLMSISQFREVEGSSLALAVSKTAKEGLAASNPNHP